MTLERIFVLMLWGVAEWVALVWLALYAAKAFA